MPRKGSLVEWTLAQEPQMDKEGDETPAHYEVLDMNVEPRWMEKLESKPRFRYFCGVPLRTENDINIGALFLIDDRPRESTSAARLKGTSFEDQGLLSPS